MPALSRPPPRPTAKLDTRNALHQRLQQFVPASELQRFTRTLTALEAHHTNELNEQLRNAHSARLAGDGAVGEASSMRHVYAAKEAKLNCDLAELRAEVTRLEKLLARCNAKYEEATARAESAEASMHASESALVTELRHLDVAHAESHRLLGEFARAHELKEAHLGALQEQVARSTSLLTQMQQQAAEMQKRLSAQQRRTMRLQESQHLVDATQRSWSAERKQLQEAAQTAARGAQEAMARQRTLEAQHAALVAEVEAERQMSQTAIRHNRELAASSEGSLRAELRQLQVRCRPFPASARACVDASATCCMRSAAHGHHGRHVEHGEHASAPLSAARLTSGSPPRADTQRGLAERRMPCDAQNWRRVHNRPVCAWSGRTAATPAPWWRLHRATALRPRPCRRDAPRGTVVPSR